MASTGSSTSTTATAGSDIISNVNKKSGSGIDISGLVTGLVAAETSQSQTNLTKDVEATNLAISSFGLLKSKVEEVSNDLNTLKKIQSRTASSSTSAISIEVTDETRAIDIETNLTVSALASGQSVSFDLSHSNFSGTFMSSATRTLNSTIDQGVVYIVKNGISHSITIDETNNTLQGLVDAMNNIDGLNAGILDTSGNGDLVLSVTSQTGLANAFSIGSADDNLAAFNSGQPASSDTSAQISLDSTAADAAFTVNGISASRSSNDITDLFDGYSLKLNNISSDAVKIESTWQVETAETRLKAFLETVNSIKAFLKTETTRGGLGIEPGSLSGDITATSVLRELSSLTTKPINGFGEDIFYLASLGVRTERDGSLSLDSDMFNKTIARDPNIMDVVFSSRYTSTNSNLKISGSTNYPPTAGTYSFVYGGGTSATLNGETLTATTNADSQKVFTGLNGDAKTLSVTLLTDISANASVRYGESLTDNLLSYISSITSSSGLINSRLDTLNNKLSSFEADQTKLDEKIEALTEDYKAKFGSMEAMVTQLNKTGEYLTSMMDAWNKKD